MRDTVLGDTPASSATCSSVTTPSGRAEGAFLAGVLAFIEVGRGKAASVGAAVRLV